MLYLGKYNITNNFANIHCRFIMDKIITLLTKKKMKMSVALPQSSCGLYSTKRLWQTTRQMKVRSLGNMLRKKKKKKPEKQRRVSSTHWSDRIVRYDMTRWKHWPDRINWGEHRNNCLNIVSRRLNTKDKTIYLVCTENREANHSEQKAVERMIKMYLEAGKVLT